MVTHAHMLGIRSSGGPVIRCPQQQKVLRAGHTMYERSMVFGCGGAALLVALSARARSTNPADGGGVQGGAFGLLGVFGVLGVAGAVFAMPDSTRANSCPFGKRMGAKGSAARHATAVPLGVRADALAASSPCVDCPPFLTRVP